MDDHFDIHVSQTYKPQTLKKWRVVPPVQENFGKPGEIGEKFVSFSLALNTFSNTSVLKSSLCLFVNPAYQ